jgi:3-deoxy-D-manno-octulosonate 8-phosphate phosphatase (KDO 8-P phosphatase)|tara:strand:- start:625 stop:1077 length:453 start_codon:yes stop_codon:yes gene_type:complete
MYKKFILDVDGVLTTGHSIYDKNGKAYKIFGPHDNDGLKILKDRIEISFISADKRGFEITKKRITDMGFSVELVGEKERKDYFINKNSEEIIFMGDGYFDSLVMDIVGYSIAPKNARKEAIQSADYVTPSRSGEGAVLDACLHIEEVFFK